MAAWLAAGKDTAVVSHESALELLGLSDVVPATIHVLVPRDRRWVHPLPGVTVHTTTHPLAPEEIVTRQGIRLTAPMRTILDVAEAGTAPEQVILAVEQARARGLVVAAQLRQAAQWRDRRVRELIERALREAA
jgi:predicted transcriptional regulator of viral defense system